MPGIENPSVWTLVLLVGIFFFAGLVHGTLGLGFQMIATPLLAMITDVRSAVLITLLPTMAVNIVSILRGGDWRDSIGKYWPLTAYVTAGSVLGTHLLIIFNPAPFKLLLAIIILFYLNMEYLRGYRMKWIKTDIHSALLVFGLIAGFLAGTVNVMVPILIILFLELDAKPTVMVQVFNMCFLTGKLTQAGVFAAAGTLNSSILAATIPLAAVAVITLLFGMVIRARVHAESYHSWLMKLLWIIAIILVIQYFTQG